MLREDERQMTMTPRREAAMAAVWPGMVLREALTLEHGGQIGVVADAEKAGQKLHDTSPCMVTRDAFAIWSGAGRWDGVDIGSAAWILSAKSEALGTKSDIAAMQNSDNLPKLTNIYS